MLEENKFSLTPRRIPEERRVTASKSRADVVMDAAEQSGSDAESGWSGVSDNSSTDSECTILEASSVASDQDLTQPTRRSEICLQDCMTLTPRGIRLF